MKKKIIVHYGEISLKGRNRNSFEKKLLENIRRSISSISGLQVRHAIGWIFISGDIEGNEDKLLRILLSMPGIETVCVAYEVEQDPKRIEAAALEILKDKLFETFRITTKRNEKTFPVSSSEMNERVGTRVVTDLGKKVKLKSPECTCYIDIVFSSAYIYTEKFTGVGGLPVGSASPLLSLLSGGIDSPVASHLMQRRGAPITYIHFDGYPATPIEGREKVIELVRVLSQFQEVSTLFLVPFHDIQKEIVEHVPEKYRVIFYRRMMLRIASYIAEREQIDALVTGESLSQVASQTVENIRAISEVVTLPILRPLIGMNKRDIQQLAERIGTYEISIQPFGDCCSLYTPKHPVTKSILSIIHFTEKNWDFQPMLERAITSTKKVTINV